MLRRRARLYSFSDDNSPEANMKNPTDVLRRKEAELERLKEEVEALRIAGKLLAEHKIDPTKPVKQGKVLQMPATPA